MGGTCTYDTLSVMSSVALGNLLSGPVGGLLSSGTVGVLLLSVAVGVLQLTDFDVNVVY